MMLAGDAPSVRRMAMSACLSVTTITCAETMLNAATATISVRMMNIILFSICDRAEEVGVAARPIADLDVDRHDPREIARDRRCREHVVQLEPHAADRVAQPVQLLRVPTVDQREPIVEFVHADLEHADDAERFSARQHARRGHRCPAA